MKKVYRSSGWAQYMNEMSAKGLAQKFYQGYLCPNFKQQGSHFFKEKKWPHALDELLDAYEKDLKEDPESTWAANKLKTDKYVILLNATVKKR